MRTRRGVCYPRPEEEVRRKRQRRSPPSSDPVVEAASLSGVDHFGILPDDLLLLIFGKLSASASSPSDLTNAILTCKRFNELGLNPMVLSRASASCLAVPPKGWSDSAHKFLQRCANAGNLDACYFLGMIRFYCLGSRGSGAALMAKAALGNHARALYSLAVIQFNGSGGTKNDRDLRAGVALCYRSAALGHVDALRELGHCLQDGYGVRRSVAEGRRLLVHANARELAAVLSSASSCCGQRKRRGYGRNGTPSWQQSDSRCPVTKAHCHPANRFLAEWFRQRSPGDGLRMCSHPRCGRPETRAHEFRRCSVCGIVNYCSRACQALHWKLAHMSECAPMDHWLDPAPAAAAPAGLAP